MLNCLSGRVATNLFYVLTIPNTPCAVSLSSLSRGVLIRSTEHNRVYYRMHPGVLVRIRCTLAYERQYHLLGGN